MSVNMYKSLIQWLFSEMELSSALKTVLARAGSLSTIIRTVAEVAFHH